MSRAAEGQTKLDAVGIDEICDLIIDGFNYTAIAEKCGLGLSSLLRWLAADPERSARAHHCRIQSAQSWDDKAENVLKDKELDPMIRRELASHYRWRASKIAPREYGDKLQIDQKTEVINLSSEEIARQRAKIQEQIEAARREALPPPGAEGATS